MEKAMSLRECAMADAEKHGVEAVKELKEKNRKRSIHARINRHKNTSIRDARSRKANGEK